METSDCPGERRGGRS